MAAALRLQMTSDPRFSKFIRDQTGWFLEKLASLQEEHDSSCASVEGLATAYSVLGRELGEEDPLMVRIRSRVELMMTTTANCRSGPVKNPSRLTTVWRSARRGFRFNAGAFLTSSKEAKMQVDVAGHCLSALIRMRNAGLSRRATAPVASNR